MSSLVHNLSTFQIIFQYIPLQIVGPSFHLKFEFPEICFNQTSLSRRNSAHKSDLCCYKSQFSLSNAFGLLSFRVLSLVIKGDLHSGYERIRSVELLGDNVSSNREMIIDLLYLNRRVLEGHL